MFLTSSLMLLVQRDDEINDDADVQDEERDPEEGELAGHFIDFEWDQRARGDDDEIPGRVALEDQADPFDGVQQGIEEGARLQRGGDASGRCP